MSTSTLALKLPVLEELKNATQMAQKRCQMLLHHDADDYVVCINSLLSNHLRPDATRLGIAYFGWVGALNSARMSFPGASEAADLYLRQFRRLQRQLKLSDKTLCSSVPGDCDQRIARMLQLEALPYAGANEDAHPKAHPHKH